jgi:rubredoxin
MGDVQYQIDPGTKFEELPKEYLDKMSEPIERSEPGFYSNNPHLQSGLKGWIEIKDRYLCIACGYIFDETVGDTDNSIEPFTSFKELSDNYICPVCAATKESFVLISDIEE